jgi:hypothetical protein
LSPGQDLLFLQERQFSWVTSPAQTGQQLEQRRAAGQSSTPTAQSLIEVVHGVIASGKNHDGNTEWTQVDIPFEAPPNGKARIAVFFVGFGRGTGVAWFDDLKLEEVDVNKAVLKVTRWAVRP